MATDTPKDGGPAKRRESRWAISVEVIEYFVDADTDVPIGASVKHEGFYSGSLTRRQAQRAFDAARAEIGR